MLQDHFLQIFLIFHGENWRCHDGSLYNYVNGVWKQSKTIEIPNTELFNVSEGLFIHLSEIDNLDWKWNSVSQEIEKILEETDDEELVEKLQEKAKISGDHLRRSTKN